MSEWPKCQKRGCKREADVDAQRHTSRSIQRMKLCFDHSDEWTRGYAIVGKALLRPITEEQFKAALADTFRR